MKRLFSILLSILVIGAMTSCGGNDTNDADTPSATATVESEPSETAAATEYAAEHAVNQEVFETPVEGSSIVGNWVDEENSASIQFNDDGTYVNDSIEGNYTLNGNTLTLSYYGGTVIEDYQIGFKDNQLVLVRGDMQLIFDKSE